MKKNILLLCCLLSLSTLLHTQIPGRAVSNYTFSKTGPAWHTSIPLPIPLAQTAPLVTVSLRCTGPVLGGRFDIRTSADAQIWDVWQPLDDDPHADLKPQQRQFELLFFPANTRFVQLRYSGLEAPLDGELVFYTPVDAPRTDPTPVQPVADRDACPCPQPAYVNRASWGGPPNQQAGCTPDYTTVTHLVVHHQASTANPPYAAVVLAIWQYHVFTNGWCDIGYNWLIAPDGTVFEGRAGGNNVVGAHFSGHNANTMGVCLLGNFQNEQPTAAALASLDKLLAWKCCDSNIEPTGASLFPGTGTVLNHICGHRDGGATECPGDNLYAKLPAVRLTTDSLYHDPSGCDGVWPPANDNCAGSTLLVSNQLCQPTAATTDGATASGVPIPACSGFTSGSALDVWFRFTAADALQRVQVTPKGQGANALDPVVALYRDACGTPQLVDCIDAPGGPGGITILDVPGLTLGQTYWIRVFDFGNVQASDGRFDICVMHGPSVATTEPGDAEGWRIYPNPANGSVIVQLPAASGAYGVFRLYDTGGVLQLEQLVKQQIARVDFAGLPGGVYFAEIRTAEIVSRRVVILHGQ